VVIIASSCIPILSQVFRRVNWRFCDLYSAVILRQWLYSAHGPCCAIVMCDLVPLCQVSQCQVSRFQRPQTNNKQTITCVAQSLSCCSVAGVERRIERAADKNILGHRRLMILGGNGKKAIPNCWTRTTEITGCVGGQFDRRLNALIATFYGTVLSTNAFVNNRDRHIYRSGALCCV